jgi:hypothetical protein
VGYFARGSRRETSRAGFGPEAIISRNNETINNPATAAPMIMSSLISISPGKLPSPAVAL